MPSDQNVLLAEAKLAAEAGDRRTQLKHLATLLKIAPPAPGPVRMLAWALFHLGEHHAAEVVINLVLPALGGPAKDADASLRGQLEARGTFGLSKLVRTAQDLAQETKEAPDRFEEPGQGPRPPRRASIGMETLVDLTARLTNPELRSVLTNLALELPPQDLVHLVDHLIDRLKQARDVAGVTIAARIAYENHKDRRTARRLAAALMDTGAESEAATLVQFGSPDMVEWLNRDPTLKDVADSLTSKRALLRELRALQVGRFQRAGDAPVRDWDTPLYVVHNSLPYATGGYATRTHGVASAMLSLGRGGAVLARPGFPDDLGQAQGVDQEIGGTPYLFRAEPGKSRFEYRHLQGSVAPVAETAQSRTAGLIHAASNYLVGLPAGLAARRLGLPFVYEVRGFWDLTRSSRNSGYEESGAGRRYKLLEDIVLDLADAVITLNDPMKDRLVEGGVDADRIVVVPNCIEPQSFASGEDDGLRRSLGIADDEVVIGYAGSFVAYEGLDDLIRAFALIHSEGAKVKLMLVGDESPLGVDYSGPRSSLKTIAADLGCRDDIIFTGRVPFQEVGRYYRAMDICPFPRKGAEVCELVSPMKPLEALAMEKAVIISDVGGMRGQVRDGETGLVTPSGDAEGLAAGLRRLVSDADRRRRLGAAGRAWVLAERTWAGQAGSLARAYDLAALSRRRIGPRMAERIAGLERI